VLELLDRARVALHPALRSLGPDLLDDDPQIGVAVRRARERSQGARPVGEVLLDQTVSAGIGNVVRCEALHGLRVDPWAPVGGLSDETLSALFEHSRRILQAGVRSGGALTEDDLRTQDLPALRRSRAPQRHGRRGAHRALVPPLARLCKAINTI